MRTFITGYICKLLGELPDVLFADDDKREKLYQHFRSYLIACGNTAQCDIESIKQLCIVIDRLNKLDDKLDKGGFEFLCDRQFNATRKSYFDQFNKLTSNLGLNPLTRVKLAVNTAHAEQVDPLLDIFKE